MGIMIERGAATCASIVLIPLRFSRLVRLRGWHDGTGISDGYLCCCKGWNLRLSIVSMVGRFACIALCRKRMLPLCCFFACICKRFLGLF